jgi:hypothetical protein
MCTEDVASLPVEGLAINDLDQWDLSLVDRIGLSGSGITAALGKFNGYPYEAEVRQSTVNDRLWFYGFVDSDGRTLEIVDDRTSRNVFVRSASSGEIITGCQLGRSGVR